MVEVTNQLWRKNSQLTILLLAGYLGLESKETRAKHPLHAKEIIKIINQPINHKFHPLLSNKTSTSTSLPPFLLRRLLRHLIRRRRTLPIEHLTLHDLGSPARGALAGQIRDDALSRVRDGLAALEERQEDDDGRAEEEPDDADDDPACEGCVRWAVSSGGFGGLGTATYQ